MATTHPSENNYLAGTLGNDQIYGDEGNDTLKTDEGSDASPTEKVLILQSLVCNSTTGGSSPDQISLKVENQPVWNSPMNAGSKANLPPLNKIFYKKVYIELFAGSTSLDGKYIWNDGNGQIPLRKGQASYTLTYYLTSNSSAI